MAAGRLLLSAIVLGRLVAAHPASKQLARPDAPDGSDIILYDSSVTKPTRLPQALVWVDDAGQPVGTATEDLLLLPTSLAPGAKSKDSTTMTTMTALSTRTLVVPVSGTSAPAGIPQAPVPLGSSPFVPMGKPSASASSGRAAPTGQTSPVVSSPRKPQDGQPANISDAGSLPALPQHFGISYAPYRADHACKTKQDIENDFGRFAGSYSLVRIYGTDCNQVDNVYAVAKAHRMKVFLGIWEPSSVEDEANQIISGVNGDWDMVHTVSVGNELVNNGQASPQQIVSAVKKARSTLRAAGYSGPVVAVDTFVAAQAHPELCEQSDYCAINAHAFFDGTVPAAESGRWLQNTISRVKSALSVHKKVVVTETGWPMKGEKNGMAVPSLQNQKSALDSIKKEFANTPGDVILFSAFNDLWKTRDMATFNSDQYWGIGGAISASDE
ncbi:putative family 17 glucosidase SCW4 [Tolypocladium ophioglossoides CBS 100239]|uniref:Putative family 17 glucosidase SCW4 n=1 Tax=Tolypocladium ophioglossoides (strain CBS 100239) TaxID=1163406 RepID=A0A0L0N9S0_TOLOC|nr:putative family 17 glucosidase SCW4 [Tolypocladium ophioglossoides CBS 100239]